MSQKLRSERAKIIYARIDREREKIRDSKLEIGNTFNATKDTLNNLKQHPMSLVAPEGFSQSSIAPLMVSKHPITTTLGMMALGWGLGYLVRNKKTRIALALAAPLGKLVEDSLNSRIVRNIASDLSFRAESVLNELINKARDKVESYVSSFKNRVDTQDVESDVPWREAPPGNSTKTYYTH